MAGVSHFEPRMHKCELIRFILPCSFHAKSASRLLIGLYPRSPNGVVDSFLAHQLPHVSNHQCMLNPCIHAGFQYLQRYSIYNTSFPQMHVRHTVCNVIGFGPQDPLTCK